MMVEVLMESFFGTDGIRGVYGKTVTPRLFYAVGAAIGGVKPQTQIVIGKDPRPSADVLESAFLAGFFSQGGKAQVLGIAPTPAVSYLTARAGADYGVVIGASHNQPAYNGVKLFGASGRKLSEREEQEISLRIKNALKGVRPRGVGERILGKTSLYREMLNCGKPLGGLKVALDNAFGSVSAFATRAFRARGATIFSANLKGKGRAINDHSGATYPAFLSSFVRKKGADIGFAFDGDGDRVILSDRYGNIYDGDDILYMLAVESRAASTVGTVLTNGGVERALKGKGITLYRAPVGDKNVAAVMRGTHSPLGAETAGHVLFSSLPTGDGIYTALRIAERFTVRGDALFCRGEYRKLPSVSMNLPLPNGKGIVWETLRKKAKEAYPSLRAVLRPSGTEPVLRIYVEGEDLSSCEACALYVKTLLGEG